MSGAQRSDWADRKCPLVLGIIVFLTSFWLLVWPPLSTTAYSAEKKRENNMEAASRSDPCVQKVLRVCAFAAFVVSRTANLGEKVGRIFSHKSLEELNGEPSNKAPAWTGDKLFGWEVIKILHETGLNNTGKLTTITATTRVLISRKGYANISDWMPCLLRHRSMRPFTRIDLPIPKPLSSRLWCVLYLRR
jgi:hypothetical protein